ncbi:MAG: ABC transporter ATP-binding protein [Steroidobacteraceae bacterium]
MSIRIEQVTKIYQGVPVVNDVTIEIPTGEFFVLLGPSGSGKSTLLRALAGLTPIDHGRIALHERDVTQLPARERGVGLVFQHYALFRHMTVAQNIEFALRVRRVKAAERRRRRQELLRLVALEGYDDRYPAQLSGGQQQRVAVARALAHEPAVLLLDEPFGALDAKIRVELRDTVRAVQRRLGMTTILVTHDQEEAFSLADRIGVMQMGRLLETGSPEELYRTPATRFVATFLGAANLFLGDISNRGLQLGSATIAPGRAGLAGATGAAGSQAVLVVRPEDIEIAAAGSTPQSRHFACGSIDSLAFAGHQQHAVVRLDNRCGIEAAVADDHHPDATVTIQVLRSATEQAQLPVQPGMTVELGIRRVHALPTPISSFHVVTADAAAAQALQAAPLLQQLTRSMQARVSVHASAGAADRLDAGVVVLPLGGGTVAAIFALVAQGARRILCIPPESALPGRIRVHAGGEVPRSELLALVSSVMRHLPVEAGFVSLQRPSATRSEVVESHRELLDARAELRGGHGLDLRTEGYVGDLRGWVQEIAALSEPTLLVLGLPSTPAALTGRLHGELGSLFEPGARLPLLLAVGAGATRSSDRATAAAGGGA